jgi:hypothetical protein
MSTQNSFHFPPMIPHLPRRYGVLFFLFFFAFFPNRVNSRASPLDRNDPGREWAVPLRTAVCEWFNVHAAMTYTGGSAISPGCEVFEPEDLAQETVVADLLMRIAHDAVEMDQAAER